MRLQVATFLRYLFGIIVTGLSWGLSASAQQNLFNVPSAEITAEGHHFFQQQFNLTNHTVSNSTIDYGVGHNFEMGINLFLDSTSLDAPEDGSPPNILGNTQKGFAFSDFYKIGIGTQSGIAAPRGGGEIKFSDFTYLTNVIDYKQHGKYYLGGYYANQAFGGGCLVLKNVYTVVAAKGERERDIHMWINPVS